MEQGRLFAWRVGGWAVHSPLAHRPLAPNAETAGPSEKRPSLRLDELRDASWFPCLFVLLGPGLGFAVYPLPHEPIDHLLQRCAGVLLIAIRGVSPSHVLGLAAGPGFRGRTRS